LVVEEKAMETSHFPLNSAVEEVQPLMGVMVGLEGVWYLLDPQSLIIMEGYLLTVNEVMTKVLGQVQGEVYTFTWMN
jgi:hypothetical protein